MIDDIRKALEVLKRGGVILYPTDTVWGLGCDATNADAVKRIYDIKKRADSKSMLLLVDDAFRLADFVVQVPEMAYQIIEVTDKPITIIYPEAKNVAPNLVAEDGSIGIRVTSDEFCKKLIAQFRKPIVSTSANITGQPTPAIYPEISSDIINAVDYVVEWRQNDNTKHSPSGIIKLGVNGQVQVIRK